MPRLQRVDLAGEAIALAKTSPSIATLCDDAVRMTLSSTRIDPKSVRELVSRTLAERFASHTLEVVDAPTAEWLIDVITAFVLVLTTPMKSVRAEAWTNALIKVQRMLCQLILPNGSRATGILVGRGAVLTASHVFQGSPPPSGTFAAFNDGNSFVLKNSVPIADGSSIGLDYAVVETQAAPGNEYLRRTAILRGWLQIPTVARPKPNADGAFVMLLHWPEADMQVSPGSAYDCANTPPAVLRYLAFTEGGSSGAPCFDAEWGLVGLHYKWGESVSAYTIASNLPNNDSLKNDPSPVGLFPPPPP